MKDLGPFFGLEPGEELAELHHFWFKTHQEGREVEFVITVREYANPVMGSMRFFAISDRQTNQKLAPFTPSGWGTDMNAALADCLRSIRKFPYQGE